jgi:hypothetical protein
MLGASKEKKASFSPHGASPPVQTVYPAALGLQTSLERGGGGEAMSGGRVGLPVELSIKELGLLQLKPCPTMRFMPATPQITALLLSCWLLPTCISVLLGTQPAPCVCSQVADTHHRPNLP